MGTPAEVVQRHTPPRPSSLREVTNGVEQPATPKPSTDTGIKPSDASPSAEDDAPLYDEDIDIFTLKPVAALKLLCHSVDSLVQMTGDVPPTPPTHRSRSPSLRTMQAEKEEEVTHPLAGRHERGQTTPRRSACDEIDGIPFEQTPIGSPEAGAAAAAHEPLRTIIIGANAEPIPVQHSAIARKFYSKRPPPIPLEEYLLRLHRYCPMSTAVYLATSVYLHRLAVVEHIVAVTGRNVHRLVLAGLRVAMKALEDLSYPHRRFARVGGVGETELGRLEVGFCFLTNFELKVDEGMLWRRAMDMRGGASVVEGSQGWEGERRMSSSVEVMDGRRAGDAI